MPPCYTKSSNSFSLSLALPECNIEQASERTRPPSTSGSPERWLIDLRFHQLGRVGLSAAITIRLGSGERGNTSQPNRARV